MAWVATQNKKTYDVRDENGLIIETVELTQIQNKAQFSFNVFVPVLINIEGKFETINGFGEWIEQRLIDIGLQCSYANNTLTITVPQNYLGGWVDVVPAGANFVSENSVIVKSPPPANSLILDSVIYYGGHYFIVIDSDIISLDKKLFYIFYSVKNSFYSIGTNYYLYQLIFKGFVTNFLQNEKSVYVNRQDNVMLTTDMPHAVNIWLVFYYKKPRYLNAIRPLSYKNGNIIKRYPEISELPAPLIFVNGHECFKDSLLMLGRKNIKVDNDFFSKTNLTTYREQTKQEFFNFTPFIFCPYKVYSYNYNGVYLYYIYASFSAGVVYGYGTHTIQRGNIGTHPARAINSCYQVLYGNVGFSAIHGLNKDHFHTQTALFPAKDTFWLTCFEENSCLQATYIRNSVLAGKYVTFWWIRKGYTQTRIQNTFAKCKHFVDCGTIFLGRIGLLPVFQGDYFPTDPNDTTYDDPTAKKEWEDNSNTQKTLRKQIFINPVTGLEEELVQIIAVRDFYTTNGTLIKRDTNGGWISNDVFIKEVDRCWIDENTYLFGKVRLAGAVHITNSTIVAQDYHICIMGADYEHNPACGEQILEMPNLYGVKIANSQIYSRKNTLLTISYNCNLVATKIDIGIDMIMHIAFEDFTPACINRKYVEGVDYGFYTGAVLTKPHEILIHCEDFALNSLYCKISLISKIKFKDRDISTIYADNNSIWSA